MLWGYVAAAIAVMGMVGTAGYMVRKSGADSVRAELQPKLTACEGQIATQNSAIEAMRQEQARKQATSAAALRKAEGRAKVWDEQSKRLQAILAGRKEGQTDCKAAWDTIRGQK